MHRGKELETCSFPVPLDPIHSKGSIAIVIISIIWQKLLFNDQLPWVRCCTQLCFTYMVSYGTWFYSTGITSCCKWTKRDLERIHWVLLSPKHVHYPQKPVGSEIVSICQNISSRDVNCLSGGRNAVEKPWFKVCQDRQWENKFSALEVYLQRYFNRVF